MICGTHLRAVRIHEECMRHGHDREPLDMTHLRMRGQVDNKHKLVFCSSAETGSSTFRTYVRKLNVGAPKNSVFRHNTGTRLLRELTAVELDQIFNDHVYFKVLVITHPFAKLASAWEYLLSQPNKSHVSRGRVQEVITQYMKRIDPTRDHDFDHTKETLTFPQFLELVCERYHTGFMNIHWASYFDNCQPCHVRYDHVFRVETLSHDMKSLYDHLRGVNKSAYMPTVMHTHKIPQINRNMEAISLNYMDVSSEIKQCMHRLYDRDFAMFGYQWHDNKASCTLTESNCC